MSIIGLLLTIAAIAALTWRLIRRDEPRRCAWCGLLSQETIVWHGGHVCTDCATAASRPADHY